jgi:hypothetical protein
VRPTAVELAGGVAEGTGGEILSIEKGDCYIPKDRCLAYVQTAEACFAEREVLREAPKAGAIQWVTVAIVGVLAFGAGVALAGAISP